MKKPMPERREIGMDNALAHADAVHTDWRDEAAKFLAWFAAHTPEFIAEDVIKAANEDVTFPKPPNPMAWGGVFQAAGRRGIIAKTGRFSTDTGNASPKIIWRKGTP